MTSTSITNAAQMTLTASRQTAQLSPVSSAIAAIITTAATMFVMICMPLLFLRRAADSDHEVTSINSLDEWNQTLLAAAGHKKLPETEEASSITAESFPSNYQLLPFLQQG